MPSKSVAVIHSNEPGWVAVRAALESIPAVERIHEARDSATARQLICDHRPAAILTSDVVDGESSLPLLTDLRQEGEYTGILGLFASDLDQCQLVAFAGLGLNGCFLWSELPTEETIHAAVLATLTEHLAVATWAVVDSYFLAQQGQDDEAIRSVQLSERQQAILRLLAYGVTEEAIALKLGFSRRTIERAVHELQETLKAPSLYVLGVRAAQLRLVR